MSDRGARELLERLIEAGVRLSLDGEQVIFVAPTGVMTLALRAEVAKYKPQHVAILRPAYCFLYFLGDKRLWERGTHPPSCPMASNCIPRASSTL